MQEDKGMGAWLGLACGDALGQAAKGLKPETIKQLYGRLDAFRDVRPFLGRGVRSYRMQGLYGCPTQLALAAADTLTRTRKADAERFADILIRFSTGGPEGYFGAFRRPDPAVFRTVSRLPDRAYFEKPDLATDLGSWLTPGLALALFYGRDSATFRQGLRVLVGMLSAHPWELCGAAVAGFLALRFAGADLPGETGPWPRAGEWIGQAAAFAADFEAGLEPAGEPAPARDGMSSLLFDLAARWQQEGPENLEPWICQRANLLMEPPVRHAAQGRVLTLLPLALVTVLKAADGFQDTLARGAAWGREADKLGALAGAWAGALYGAEAIPDSLRSGLVNLREVRLRGEALLRRRPVKGKDLVAMELALTQKEAEERRKHLPREPKKKSRDSSPALKDLFLEMGVEWEEDPLAELREDPRKWRQFEREKTRKKKERRKGPGRGGGF